MAWAVRGTHDGMDARLLPAFRAIAAFAESTRLESRDSVLPWRGARCERGPTRGAQALSGLGWRRGRREG